MRPLLPFLAVFDVSEQSCVHSDIRLQNGDEIAHVPRLVATIKTSVFLVKFYHNHVKFRF